MARINTLTSHCEYLEYQLNDAEHKLLAAAMALNPDFPMADGFKAQWNTYKARINQVQEELNAVIEEINELNGNNDYKYREHDYNF
jgi:hypothetical protein